MDNQSYLTIEKPATLELTIERSRFIGHCEKVTTETAAKEFIAQIRTLHAQATHNCYAYRIGATTPFEYYHDHGEPSGTAGKPILGGIQRLDLTNVVVVVTRYFGGKKLGVRGLIEAYGQTATLTLEQAGTVLHIPKLSATLNCNYSEYDHLLYRLKQIEAEIIESIFTDKITLQLTLPSFKKQNLVELIEEFPQIKIKIF